LIDFFKKPTIERRVAIVVVVVVVVVVVSCS